jgi:hypothetical protein
MTLDLSDEEIAALAHLLNATIDGDRFPLSRCPSLDHSGEHVVIPWHPLRTINILRDKPDYHVERHPRTRLGVGAG